MRVLILGSAAGGGLPQWNCRCANCQAARSGSSDVRPRTQSSVAVSTDGRSWFLLNASADVRQQTARHEELAPPGGAPRGTSIAGCVLTDAEIDHTSGLLQLREGCIFGIFSTALVHRWLAAHLGIDAVLANFADRPWTDLPLDTFRDLPLPDGKPSGLRVRAFEVGCDAPRFVPIDEREGVGAVIALEIEDVATGGVLLSAPGIESISDSLRASAASANAILVDGTFWTDDEPIRMNITDRTATQMGHVPVSGPQGTLSWLSSLSARVRVYLHINNTNPMLNESGPEWQHVIDQGIQVGMDGDSFEI